MKSFGSVCRACERLIGPIQFYTRPEIISDVNRFTDIFDLLSFLYVTYISRIINPLSVGTRLAVHSRKTHKPYTAFIGRALKVVSAHLHIYTFEQRSSCNSMACIAVMGVDNVDF